MLVQQSRLGEITRDELAEVITDAWLATAPEEAGPRVPRDERRGGPDGLGRPARLAAYDVLVAVREDDAYANLVLPQLLRERRIEGRDAAFTTELVGGTLRGLGAYDAVIDHLAGRRPDPARPRRAPPRRPPAARRCGCPTTPRSTSTVELVRTRVGHKPAGFTNAVMRRIAERDLDAWMDLLDAPTSRAVLAPASGSWRSWPARWTGPTSWRRCWPPTTSDRG